MHCACTIANDDKTYRTLYTSSHFAEEEKSELIGKIAVLLATNTVAFNQIMIEQKLHVMFQPEPRQEISDASLASYQQHG
jgi:hypothetical protein